MHVNAITAIIKSDTKVVKPLNTYRPWNYFYPTISNYPPSIVSSKAELNSFKIPIENVRGEK